MSIRIKPVLEDEINEFKEVADRWFEDVKKYHLSEEFQKDNDAYYRRVTNFTPEKLFLRYTI